MGIKFITQFLFRNTIDINDPRLTDQQLPDGSVLVIDGFNYLHYLEDKFVLNLGAHLNGTYDSMRYILRSEILELQDYMIWDCKSFLFLMETAIMIVIPYQHLQSKIKTLTVLRREKYLI